MREFPHPGHYARFSTFMATTVTGRGEEHFQGHERLRSEATYNISYKKTLETYAAREGHRPTKYIYKEVGITTLAVRPIAV